MKVKKVWRRLGPGLLKKRFLLKKKQNKRFKRLKHVFFQSVFFSTAKIDEKHETFYFEKCNVNYLSIWCLPRFFKSVNAIKCAYSKVKFLNK